MPRQTGEISKAGLFPCRNAAKTNFKDHAGVLSLYFMRILSKNQVFNELSFLYFEILYTRIKL